MSLTIPAGRTYESGLGTWIGRFSSTVTHDLTRAAFGSGSAKVVTPGTQQFEGISSSLAAVADSIPVSPSTQYTLSVYSDFPSGQQFNLFMRQDTSAGVFVSNLQSPALTGTGVAWDRYTYTFTTDATAGLLREIRMTSRALATSITFWVDGWQLDQAATAQTYDGADAGPPPPPPQIILPDADLDATGWTTAPLFSKVNDSSDLTVISATCT